MGDSPDGTTHEHVVDIPPHKEGQVVEGAGRALRAVVDGTVCVTAGIHIDNASKEEIDIILQMANDGIARLVRSLQKPDTEDV